MKIMVWYYFNETVKEVLRDVSIKDKVYVMSLFLYVIYLTWFISHLRLEL